MVQPFYHRATTVTSEHFRTSSHVGGPFVSAIADVIDFVDRELGFPERLEVIDIGAGEGTLLTGVLELGRRWLPRAVLTGVDVRSAPVSLDSRINWLVGPAPIAVPTAINGVVLACEILDDVDGDRAAVAAELANRVDRGLALFVDYPGDESTVGYRFGRQVVPINDGSSNVTRSVDFRAVAAALAHVGDVRWQRQADACTSGIQGAGAGAWAGSGLTGIARIEWDSKLAELRDPRGLGSHVWLSVARGITHPWQDAHR